MHVLSSCDWLHPFWLLFKAYLVQIAMFHLKQNRTKETTWGLSAGREHGKETHLDVCFLLDVSSCLLKFSVWRSQEHDPECCHFKPRSCCHTRHNKANVCGKHFTCITSPPLSAVISKECWQGIKHQVIYSLVKSESAWLHPAELRFEAPKVLLLYKCW